MTLHTYDIYTLNSCPSDAIKAIHRTPHDAMITVDHGPQDAIIASNHCFSDAVDVRNQINHRADASASKQNPARHGGHERPGEEARGDGERRRALQGKGGNGENKRLLFPCINKCVFFSYGSPNQSIITIIVIIVSPLFVLGV